MLEYIKRNTANGWDDDKREKGNDGENEMYTTIRDTDDCGALVSMMFEVWCVLRKKKFRT